MRAFSTAFECDSVKLSAQVQKSSRLDRISSSGASDTGLLPKAERASVPPLPSVRNAHASISAWEEDFSMNSLAAEVDSK